MPSGLELYGGDIAAEVSGMVVLLFEGVVFKDPLVKYPCSRGEN